MYLHTRDAHMRARGQAEDTCSTIRVGARRDVDSRECDCVCVCVCRLTISGACKKSTKLGVAKIVTREKKVYRDRGLSVADSVNLA